MAEEKSAKAEKPAAATTAQSSSADEPKLFGALCYIIGVLVPLFILFTEKKNDKFMAFHAWQSLIFTAVWIVIWIVLVGVSIVATVLTAFIGGLGGFISCLFLPVGLVAFCAAIFCAYKAYMGEKYKLPVIGDFAEKQASK